MTLGAALEASAASSAARGALGGREDVWLVGGALRDAVLGRAVVDLDLAVGAAEADVARDLARAAGGHAFELSEEFATWRVMAREGDWHVDVARLRGDSIEADLAARDFTANAMALPLATAGPGTSEEDLLDPHHGLRDLRARTLRTVSERSFAADPIRLLRGPRIAAALGLDIEPETVALARAVAPRAAEPASERQFAELRGVVAGADPLRGLELMDELGLIGVVLPEVEALRGVEQGPNHHLDVYGHSLAVLGALLEMEADLAPYAGRRAQEVEELLAEPLADELTRGGALRFGALLHDIGKPATRGERGRWVTFIGHDQVGARMIEAVCERLRTSRRLSRHLQHLALHHLRLGFLVHERPLSGRRVHEYLRATEPVAADVTLLTVADRLAARGEAELASAEMVEAHVDLAREMLAAALDWRRDGPPPRPIPGDELAGELGIEPGPELGRVLREIEAAQYAGEVSGRADAIELARQLLAG
jgi:poly(A) polymerase